MSPLSRLALLPISLFLSVLLVQEPVSPKQKELLPKAVYHSDQDHLWNRVHDTFYTRTGPAPVRY